MSYEDSHWGNNAGGPNRRPPSRYNNDQQGNYSPSSSYLPHQNQNADRGNFQQGGGQPRRRFDRYRRESLNYSDKSARQNDIIIRLLKEIRDRLPPRPDMPHANGPTLYGAGNPQTQSETADDGMHYADTEGDTGSQNADDMDTDDDMESSSNDRHDERDERRQ